MRKALFTVVFLLVWATSVLAQNRAPRAVLPLSDAQAAAIIEAQATHWWSTHALSVSDGADVTTWSPRVGSVDFTAALADKPKWRTTNVAGEPGDIRLSPNGKPSLHFYDGTNRKMTATLSTGTTNQTWEFVLALDWVPGSGQLFCASKDSANTDSKNVFFSSTASNQRYPWTIAYNGGAGSQTKTNDGRQIGVLTLKWSNANSVTIKWNNQDSATIDLSAAFSAGALDFWQLGASVFGAGHAEKFWSVYQDNALSTDTEDAQRFAAYERLFGLLGTADVKSEASANQGNFILKPLRQPNGKLFIWNHGAGLNAQQMCLQTLPYATIAQAFVKSGWYVACSNASFDNWGNATAITDLNNLYDYVAANYTLSGGVVMGGHSMGSLLSLNAARLGSSALTTALDGVLHVGNGVADLRDPYDVNSSFRSAICTAYSITNCVAPHGTSSDYAAQTSGYNAVLQAASGWANYHFLFRTSSGDTLIDRATHPAAMITVLTGNVASLTQSTGNCDHGDSGCGGSPSYMFTTEIIQWANRITN